MNKTERSEAIKIAEWLETIGCGSWHSYSPQKASAELRRLHAENETLRTGYDAARLEIASLHAQMEAIGAGGVEPLRKRYLDESDSEPLDKIMELADMYVHAAITDGCPVDRLPRNVLRRAIADALAAAPAQPVVWPRNATDVRAFMASNCEAQEYANDDASPSDDDRYQLTAHDFLEAVGWWADHPHHPRSPQPPAQEQDARKPLTDKQVLSALASITHEAPSQLPLGWAKFARAIEAAHGIAAQQGGA